MAIGAAEYVNTIVIGAGQAGLSAGYHLARRGVEFLILDAGGRVGDVWRERWDSLRLFTPARYAGLDGMPFKAAPFYFPTKDEFADYLEAYAARFALPVRMRTRVDRLSKAGNRFLVVAGERRFEADNVIVAMATYQRRRVPSFASELSPAVRQLHSLEYRNPSQWQAGGVLVVGAGNSGAEIAIEAARDHETWLSGPDTGHVPFRIDGLPARLFVTTFVLRVLFHRVLSLATPIGRRARPRVLGAAAPLIRTKPRDLRDAGVRRVPRVVGIRNGGPLLEDGRVLDVANVVWCTGFDAGLSWIDLPVFDASGEPRHHAGIAEDQPGLYFVGRHFQYAFSSDMIHGVGRDAARIADAIAGAARPASRLTAAAAL
jgi:putative flavoprotein involved in K+ transport